MEKGSVEHAGKVVHAIFNKREEYLGVYFKTRSTINGR